MRHDLYPKIIAHGPEFVLNGSNADFGGWVDRGDGTAELIEAFLTHNSTDEECVDFRGLPPHLDNLELYVGYDTYAEGMTPRDLEAREAATQLAILRYAVGTCQNLPLHITPHYKDERDDPRSSRYRHIRG